jgi:hypothetical protein
MVPSTICREEEEEEEDELEEEEEEGMIICDNISEDDLADSYICSDCQPARLLKGPQGIVDFKQIRT